MRQRYGIITGTLLIALLLVSNISSVYLSSAENTTKEKQPLNATNVDPNIHIGKNKLTTLEKSLQYIDNPDVRSLVQAIINEIKKDGVATSKDIEQIESDLQLPYHIHAGRVNNFGPGDSYEFPGFFVGQIVFIRWGPAIYVNWICTGSEGYCKINVFLHVYHGPHTGYIIGFLGFVSFPYPSCWYEGVWGTGTLIIIGQ